MITPNNELGYFVTFGQDAKQNIFNTVIFIRVKFHRILYILQHPLFIFLMYILVKKNENIINKMFGIDNIYNLLTWSEEVFFFTFIFDINKYKIFINYL